MRRLALLALLCWPLAGQTITQPLGAGGGASALDDLTDVTAPTPASGDGFHYNGTAWVNTALFTAGTTDILAARMAANWGAAGASACASTGGIMYYDGSGIVCDSDLIFNGAEFGDNTVGGPLLRVSAPTSTVLPYGFQGDQDTGLGRPGTNIVGLYAATNLLASFGGGQTALFQDPTDTKVIVKGASGGTQTENLQEWQDSAGLTHAKVTKEGYLEARSRFYLNSGSSAFWTTTSLGLPSDSSVQWAATTNASAAKDTGIARSGIGVAKITNGSTGYGKLDLAGLRISGAAPDGYPLIGNGTDGVFRAITYADISDAPPQYDVLGGYYTTGASPAYFSTQLLGGSAGTAYRLTCQTETGTIDLAVTFTTSPGSAGTAVHTINDCGTTLSEVTSFSGTTGITADSYVRVAFSDEQSGFDIVHWSIEVLLP